MKVAKIFNIYTFFFVLIIALSFITKKNAELYSENESKKKIQIKFQKWTFEAIHNKKFFAKDSCNYLYIEQKIENGLTVIDAIGIPTYNEIKFSYSHFNNDNKIDALITFTPYQCDGSNASMWKQIQLLAISKNENYIIDENYFEFLQSNDLCFYLLDSSSTNYVYGKQYMFLNNDPHCCPSISKEIRISTRNKKLEFYKSLKR